MRFNLYKSNEKKPIGYRFLAVGIAVTTGLGLAISTPSLANSKSQQQIQSSHQIINLSKAVTMTLESHPELKALVAEEAVWQGNIEQAAIGERPQIGLMIEDALGTGEHSALKSMQSTLTYSWLLQQDQIDGRVNAAKSQASAVIVEQKIKALDLSAIVAKQFVEILIKQERLKLNQLAVSQAQEVVDAIANRVKAGKSSNVEMRLAQAELVRRNLAVEDLEHELKASHYQLSSLWGKPQAELKLTGNLMLKPEIPSVESQLIKLKQVPQIQQFVNEQRIAQSQMELARIEAKPQWQLTAGLRRYEATDDFGLVAGISIPWGNDNSNAGTIAALRAKQDVLATQQQALMQKLDAQLYVLLQEMAHSHHVIETIQAEIIPVLETALTEASQAFDIGKLSYNQWSDIRRELLSAQNQLLDAYQSLHLQHIEIQRLTGVSVSDSE
ncbi:TolC family protein [Pseudoalteromonas sp. S4389]|jgi:cobalt-zinc-cadmium efflux system outer membrane protein|uniref:TolC family protein n=1 Tax=Pseudoalteromonas TaxID=53246 RepID=UPI001108522A|nr:TolC family protein [Pseudoalteromonas sp. S4389]TMO40571.1 TolC family protein [Pseudoalteromonas sp. S4389]